MQFTLFCCQISFVAIYAVLLQNMFCRNLRTLYEETNWAKNIVCGEKMTNIMYEYDHHVIVISMQYDHHIILIWWCGGHEYDDDEDLHHDEYDDDDEDLHHDGLPGDLLSRPRHPQHPGDPLEKDCSHLIMIIIIIVVIIIIMITVMLFILLVMIGGLADRWRSAVSPQLQP